MADRFPTSQSRGYPALFQSRWVSGAGLLRDRGLRTYRLTPILRRIGTTSPGIRKRKKHDVDYLSEQNITEL